MAEATLSINSRNYGSWSLRGWLLCRMAGLDCRVDMVSADDPSGRAELLLLSPSFLVPCLTHDGIKVWDTLAIAEYLNELKPEAGLLPQVARRARALPRDLRRDAFGLFQPALGAADEPARALSRRSRSGPACRPTSTAWWRSGASASPNMAGRSCSATSPTIADAMYAPVCTRFLTYDVKLDSDCAAYCAAIMALPAMKEWAEDAKLEPEEVEELDVEF